MKRAIGIIIIFAAVSVAGNAQYFVEGSVAMDFTDDIISWRNTDVQNKKTGYEFYFMASPAVGYQLNDKLALGLKPSFSTEISKRTPQDNATGAFLDEVIRRQRGWNLGAFCRYEFWGTEKLSFLVESSVFIGGGNTVEETGSITKKIKSRSSLGIRVTPLITYDFSDKWSMIATYPSYLRFDYETIKNEETGIINKPYLFWLDRVFFFYPSDFSIGIIYHF